MLPSGNDAATSDLVAIYRDCVTPGHWRTCRACKESRERAIRGAEDTRDSDSECCICGKWKSRYYFQDGLDFCAACNLEVDYTVVHCTQWKKMAYRKECTENPCQMEEDVDLTFICKKCCPVEECFYCKKEKHKDLFTQRYYKPSQQPRCKACCTCSVCGFQKGPQSLEPCQIPVRCFQCYHKSKKHKCDVALCNQMLPIDKFDHNVLKHARVHGRHAVCLKCQDLGYSPADLTTYSCQAKENCNKGHLEFPAGALSDWKRGSSSKLSCSTCLVHAEIEKKKPAWKRKNEDVFSSEGSDRICALPRHVNY